MQDNTSDTGASTYAHLSLSPPSRSTSLPPPNPTPPPPPRVSPCPSPPRPPQSNLLRQGRGSEVVLETRLWDEVKGATYSMRKKEGQADYRYFPEPDLPRLEVTPELLEEVKVRAEAVLCVLCVCCAVL